MKAVGPPVPLHWEAAAKEDRLLKSVMRCQVRDGERVRSFIRGRLVLPVNEPESVDFCWLVWVSVSEATWKMLEDHWTDKDRAKLPAFYGILAVDLPYAPETFGLPMTCKMAEPNAGADFWLQKGVEHQLAVDAEKGITGERAQQFEKTARRLGYTG